MLKINNCKNYNYSCNLVRLKFLNRLLMMPFDYTYSSAAYCFAAHTKAVSSSLIHEGNAFPVCNYRLHTFLFYCNENNKLCY